MGKRTGSSLIVFFIILLLFSGCLINDPAFETYDKDAILASEKVVIVATVTPIAKGHVSQGSQSKKAR